MAINLKAALLAAALAIGTINSSMAASDMTHLSNNLVVISLSESELAARKIATIALGDLELPTGRIIATDPLVQPDHAAFERAVPPGRYPVTLYQAQHRVAMSAVRFAPGAITRWEMATLPGQDLAKLEPNKIYGYGVDAGMGCFMDATAVKAIERREAFEVQKLKATRHGYSNYYDDVISGEFAGGHDNYLMHRPMADDPVNVAIFQSGWGDGFYASYWGLDAAGKPLILVTDFDVLEDGDGRSEFDKYKDGKIAAMSRGQRADSKAGYEALKQNDIAGLQALLASGRIAPETFIEEVAGSFTSEAVRLDRPAGLELLIRYGAVAAIPDDHVSRMASWKTYPDYARVLDRNAREKGKPAPRSPELMAIIRRWEAGEIPLADDAPARRAQTGGPSK